MNTHVRYTAELTTAMLSKNIRFLFVVFLLFSTDANNSIFGAKILFIPANMNSHVLCFSRLAVDLTQLGHVTRVLAPSNARVPQFVAEAENGGNFSYTTYPVDGAEPYLNSRQVSEGLTRVAMSQSVWERFCGVSQLLKDVFARQESDCVRLLDNRDLMRQIRAAGFQFAVMDGMIPQCYLAIPYSMRVRYAILSVPAMAWTYRVPRLPSFASTLELGYTDRMTLFQRLTTFVFQILIMYRLRNDTTAYVDRLAPDRPSISASQLAQQVRLCIELKVPDSRALRASSTCPRAIYT